MKANLQTLFRILETATSLRSLMAFSLIGLTIACSGCASLSGLNQSETTPIARQRSSGQYKVEMSGGWSKVDPYIGELDGPLTVQTALERSGAIKKFRHMDVMVYRIVEETGKPLKMPVRYDAGKKSITPEQDYALMHGDRIVVESVTNNFIDKMVNSASGK